MEERRNIASTATSFLQTVESTVLDTALKAPDQKIQKVQNSTLGKKKIRPDTHRSIFTNWAMDLAMRKVNKYCMSPFM